MWMLFGIKPGTCLLALLSLLAETPSHRSDGVEQPHSFARQDQLRRLQVEA